MLTIQLVHFIKLLHFPYIVAALYKVSFTKFVMPVCVCVCVTSHGGTQVRRLTVRCLTVRCLTVRCLTVRCLTVRCLTVRCLTVWCLTVRCLTVWCLTVRCLTVRCLTVRCLTVRCLTFRCLTVRCLTVRCLTVRSLTVRCLTGFSLVFQRKVSHRCRNTSLSPVSHREVSHRCLITGLSPWGVDDRIDDRVVEVPFNRWGRYHPRMLIWKRGLWQWRDYGHFILVWCEATTYNNNVREIFVKLAHKEIIQKPNYITERWNAVLQPLKDVLTNGIDEIYLKLEPTTRKVLQLLKDEPTSSDERAVLGYLKRFIWGLEVTQLKRFLVFTTGSDLMVCDRLDINFVKVDGLGRRPIARTCGPCLELPTTWTSRRILFNIMCKYLGNGHRMNFIIMNYFPPGVRNILWTCKNLQFQ